MGTDGLIVRPFLITDGIMFEIIFYNSTNAPNTINKTLTGGKSVVGLANNVSLISPNIVVRDAEYTAYNYAYIPTYKRYYFVTGVVNDGNGKVALSLKCDVLQSFADAIKRARGIVVSSDTGNGYLSTHNGIYDTRPIFTRTEFSNSVFNETGSLIMVTLKGKVS